MKEIIKYLIIFFVLLLIALAVIIGWMISSPAKKIEISSPNQIFGAPFVPGITGSYPIPSTSGLMEPCIYRPCSAGYVCDGFSFLCKKGQGEFCTEYAECANNLYCSGICVTGANGGLNQYCPCDEDYLCMSLTGPQYPLVCKGSGAPCSNDFDCASLNCNFGICEKGYPLAYPCTEDSQCASLNCSIGFCQPFGITTGNLGSACAGSCVGYQGSSCAVAAGYSYVCSCGTGGYPGTCINGNTGLLSSCNSVFKCNSYFTCYNSGTGATACSGNNCVCRFPYQNPNVVDSSNQCISGMSGINGICYNSLFGGCDQSSQCAGTLTCNQSTPILASYSFTGAGPNFLGSPTVSLKYEPAIISGATGSISPIKGFSNGYSFFVSDANYGVLSYEGLFFTQVLSNNVFGQVIDATFRSFDIPYAFVAVKQGNYSVVYIGLDGKFGNSMVPFNVQSGAGPNGTQYDISGNPIDINYLAVSNGTGGNYTVALVSNGTIYLKDFTDTKYRIGVIQGGRYSGQMMNQTTGPAFFYSDYGAEGQNLAFVRFWDQGGNLNSRLLQFSGDAAGPDGFEYAVPLDNFMSTGENFGELYFKVINFSLFPGYSGSTFKDVVIVILAAAYFSQNDLFSHYSVILYNNTTYTYFPYQVGETFLPIATLNNYYLLSKGGCGN